MAVPKQDNSHGLGDVWRRLNEQSDQISLIATAQGKTDAKLDALNQKIDAAFGQLHTSLQSISSDVHRPMNWPAIWSALIATIGGMAMFVVAYAAPLYQRISTLEEREQVVTAELMDNAYVHGRAEANEVWVERWADLTNSRLSLLESRREN